MRKAIFALLLTLIPAGASAQTFGCYVDSGTLATYGGTFLCNLSTAHPVPSSCGYNYLGDIQSFGPSIADMCQKIRADEAELRNNRDEWINYATEIEAHWKACGATNDQIRGSIFYWQGLAQYYEGLANRVKSKCGSKCRNVR